MKNSEKKIHNVFFPLGFVVGFLILAITELLINAFQRNS